MFRVNCGVVRVFNEEGYELDDVIVRKEIARFAIAMENEMSKKDEKYGKDSMKYGLEYLIRHLLSERIEASIEIDRYAKDNILSSNLYVELVHEAIMSMIVGNKIEELSKLME